MSDTWAQRGGRVAVVQHVPWERPALIGKLLASAGLSVEVRHVLYGDAVPDPAELAGLVVMGGPMRATDMVAHPALAREIDLLRAAVELDVPVLGVCLGHQLLGIALGGELRTDRPPEIGVGPVDLVAGSPLGPQGSTVDVLHWHGDQVSLPPGAELIARSEACGNQAFRHGSAWGLQFHLEVDRPLLQHWLATPAMRAELPEGSSVVRDFTRAEDSLRLVARAMFGDFATRARARVPV